MTTPAAPRLTLKKVYTIPYNKVIRNCMKLSGILTVQAPCVFSWAPPNLAQCLDLPLHTAHHGGETA